MLLRLLVRFACNAVALYVAAALLDGVTYGDAGWTLVVAAVVFTLVNMWLRPVVRLLSLPFIILTLGLFLLVVNVLMLYVTDWIVGPFEIHRVQNSGIAFGLFSSATAVVIVLTAIAVGWMIVFFARSGSRHPVIPAALGLLIGGSVSNLADRVRLGHVTDFLDVGWWPAFNLADTFIVLGVAILLATLVAADAKPRRPKRHLDVAR